MIFICELFEGKVFNYLKQKGFRLVFITIKFGCVTILGLPCVLACALQEKVIALLKRCYINYVPTTENQELPVSSRPTFCCTMCNVVVCFTGFKDQEYLVCYLEIHLHVYRTLFLQDHLCYLVHLMGGSVPTNSGFVKGSKEMSSCVTHVVANTVLGKRYKVFTNVCTIPTAYGGCNFCL